MSRELREVATICGGCALSLILVAFGIALALRTTQWGEVATGQSQSLADPWAAFQSGYYLLLFEITLPSAGLAGLMVGVLTKRLAALKSSLAVAPLAVLASGLELRGAKETAAVLICGAVFGAVGAWFHRSLPAATLRT
jgi:hypothetical protein